MSSDESLQNLQNKLPDFKVQIIDDKGETQIPENFEDDEKEILNLYLKAISEIPGRQNFIMFPK